MFSIYTRGLKTHKQDFILTANLSQKNYNVEVLGKKTLSLLLKNKTYEYLLCIIYYHLFILSSPTDKRVIKEWHFYFQQPWIIFLCILCGLLSSISNRFSPCIIPLCFYSPFQHEGFVCLFVFWQHLNFLCLYSINSDVLFNCSFFKTSCIYYLYHFTMLLRCLSIF